MQFERLLKPYDPFDTPIHAGDKVELAEELRDIRLILDGIESDPFFGK